MGAGDSREAPRGVSSGLTAEQFIARIRDVGAALLATDTDRHLIQWGGAAERIFGFTPEEALGRRSDELGIVALDYVQAMRKVLFSRPEKPVEQEIPLRRKDGTTFPGWVRYALSFDRDGNVDGTTVFILDLTQAQRADVEIPTPTSFAPVVEVATMILRGTSREELLGRCVRLVSTALGADLAGVFSPAPAGRGLRLERGAGWREGTVGPALELSANEEALLRSPELQVVHADHVPPGGLLDAHDVASGLIVPVGEPGYERGALAAFTRTPREFGEQEHEFAKAVALMISAAAEVARVRELETRFHRASRLEAMGQLTGGIAHDFNNLLAVVLNYASFAREDVRAGADAEESIAEIEKAARRAATRQLLVFSRQEAVALEPVDIAAAIDQARGLLSLTLGEQIAHEVEVEPGLGPVELGAGQLEQILVNLAVNARDAMDEGGTFRIAAKEIGGGGVGPAWIRLTVVDDGAGMSPEVREKAFQPFFTTKPVGEGSGFGLATVFGIVSGAGGSIEIRSEPGEGTEIEMLLPVADDPGDARGGEPASGAGASARRVLLVEDDEMVRRLTARLLTRGGYEVVEADGPAEAIAAIRADLDGGAHDGGPPALLLTDVVMPETSGVELALRVQQLVPGIKVVFMSGYTGDSVPREAVYEIEAGFVEKPFTPETLFESIGRALGRHVDDDR